MIEDKETKVKPRNKKEVYKKGDTVKIPIGQKREINGIMYSAGKHTIRS